MKNLIILFVCLLPLLFIWGCTEASSPGYEDPTDPAVAPRVVWAWLDSQKPYYRIWDMYAKQSDSLPLGYIPGRLLIRFNKIMLSYTVIPNVTLLPKEDGFAQLSTYGATSIDGQTFELPIYGYFKVGHTYTVIVDKEATDVTNKNLEADYQKLLVPEPVLRIISTYPENNDTSINSDNSFSSNFNSPIDSSTLSDNITITPYLKGKWKTYDYMRQVYFHPDSGFKGNTWYEITFSAGVRDTNNNHLPSPRTFRFKTILFKIMQTYPWDGQPNINRSEDIYVAFSTGISRSSALNSFSISPSIEGAFTFFNSSYYFDPLHSLLPDTTYTVTIRSSMRSIAGDTLAAPYTFSFRTSN